MDLGFGFPFHLFFPDFGNFHSGETDAWVCVGVDEKKVPQGKDILEVALPLTRTWRAGLLKYNLPHSLLVNKASDP